MIAHPHRDFIQRYGLLLGLIVFMVLVFIVQLVVGPDGYRSFMAIPEKIETSWQALLAGEISLGKLLPLGTLLTYAFLHGDPEHLLYNMIFLWMFGALLLELLGKTWLIVLFVITAIAGALAHILLNPGDTIPMLGASGAVMGFEGAYLGMAVRWRLPDPHIWPMARPIPPGHLAAIAVIGIALDFSGIMDHGSTGIAYGAHIGGFLAGLFLTSLIIPRHHVRV